jgi:hypothetical protein
MPHRKLHVGDTDDLIFAQSTPMHRIQFDQPEHWPDSLHTALGHARSWSLDWCEDDSPWSSRYESEIQALLRSVHDCALKGWHCTRLREAEAQSIRDSGMAVLSESLVNRRIAAARAAGELSQDVADRLSTTHRASDPRRQGQIWFGFSPALPDEHATERLFRYWGGEAVYWAHERGTEISAVLRRIGHPSIIDAWVPISDLQPLAQEAILKCLCLVDLHAAGADVARPFADVEGNVQKAIPATAILAIDQHPSASFVARTRCDTWHEPL